MHVSFIPIALAALTPYQKSKAGDSPSLYLNDLEAKKTEKAKVFVLPQMSRAMVKGCENIILKTEVIPFSPLSNHGRSGQMSALDLD